MYDFYSSSSLRRCALAFARVRLCLSYLQTSSIHGNYEGAEPPQFRQPIFCSSNDIQTKVRLSMMQLRKSKNGNRLVKIFRQKYTE